MARMKQANRVFARHEALLNVAQFQPVQLQHILLVFLLEDGLHHLGGHLRVGVDI